MIIYNEMYSYDRSGSSLALRENERLERNLSQCGRGLDNTLRTNILSVAQTEASTAFAKGDRLAYPRKHYQKLESIFRRPMSAAELQCFSCAYEAYFTWNQNVAEQA